MSDLTSLSKGAALGLDHVGIVGADLDELARTFAGLGFCLTPYATHASGRTANRCVMLRDGYLELISTVPGRSSATLERFLARGPGAHIFALEVADEGAALDRLRRSGLAGTPSLTSRAAGLDGTQARFALIAPPDTPEGRMLLIRHFTPELLWRPDVVRHSNGATGLHEVVYSSGAPAETMSRLSRLAGRPAEPDLLGGYRIPLARGCVRILPPAAAMVMFPGITSATPLLGLTLTATGPRIPDGVVHAGGVAIRFLPSTD